MRGHVGHLRFLLSCRKPLFIHKVECMGQGSVAAKLKLEGQDVGYTPTADRESLHSHVLQWLHEQPEDTQLHQMSELDSTFPDGPHQLDIIIANAEGML